MRLTKEELKNKVLEYGDWEPWLSRDFYAFIISIFIGGNSRESMRKLGFDIEHPAALFQEGTWYESKKVFDEAVQDIKKGFENGLTVKKVSESCEHYLSESKKKLSLLISDDSKNKRQKFVEAMEIVRGVIGYFWLAHDFEYYLMPIFKKEFAKYFSGDIEKIIGDISYPVKKNSHVIFEEKLLAGEDIGILLGEFCWIKARDGFGDPFARAELLELKEKLQAEPKAKAPQIQIPKQLNHLVAEARELVYYRTLRSDVFFELLFLARPIIKDYGLKYGIEFKDIKYYSIYDLIAEKPLRRPVQVTCAMYQNQGYFYENPILDTKLQGTAKIKGTVAFSGKVRGVVKVVNLNTELNKVNEGDILVTHMTTPSYIVAMKKAAGFVTNEGGLTCHAAIIARELKKPCIIGTKIATKILRDGDLVEVDAEKGIVKIIKAAKV